MNRWLLIGSLACLLVASTGCRMGCGTAGGCGSGACSSGACESSYGQYGDCGSCESCNECQPVGVIGKLKAKFGCGGCGGGCGSRMLGCLCGGGCKDGSCGAGGRVGCPAGPLGWQQGGLDYSSHLRPGLLGHDAPAALNNRPFTPGPPSAQVAYPYYTHKGPRDFLLDNPPTIGR